ncbi:O-antigen ligase family protein [Moritella sp. F3]|uniref:O-antigen ligase family protein n=1 Tax=Moritella sp. F3 TaxID=2718882 RepID=UPI0018E19C6B|nr:O-antigen ligase family protein [Moritella sp. F3]GIC77282.1 membrane protein [Moritella sp. F1]GIC83190.1 membrane protein [Moritella sp. F3]
MKINTITKLNTNVSGKLIPILACLFPILCLAYGKGYKAIPAILLLFSLPVLFSTPRQTLTKDTKVLIGAFLFYFGIFVFSALLNGDSLSKLDGPSRFILCIPIFIALLRYPPPFSWVSNSIVVASYIAGTAALILVFHYGQGRAFSSGYDFFSKGYMPIQSGNIAMTFGIICLPIATYYLKKTALITSIICSFGAAFGISGSYLSGSRGSWIFVPIAILFLLYINRKYIQKTKTTLVAFIIIIVPTLSMLTVINITPTMQQKSSRIEQLSREIDMYESGEMPESESSSGIRLELWRDSGYTFIEAPFVGVGYETRNELRAQRQAEGLISIPSNYLTGHAHSQYFETLAVRGILGFIGLMGIFIAPLFIFRQLYRDGNEQVKTIAQCGVLSVIMMMGYCLTQAMFRHNSGAIFYPLMTVILLGSGLALAKKEVEN